MLACLLGPICPTAECEKSKFQFDNAGPGSKSLGNRESAS